MGEITEYAIAGGSREDEEGSQFQDFHRVSCRVRLTDDGQERDVGEDGSPRDLSHGKLDVVHASRSGSEEEELDVVDCEGDVWRGQ
jgi:hypothetical protein